MRISGTDAAINNIRAGNKQHSTVNRTVPAEQKRASEVSKPQRKSTQTAEYPITEKVVSEAVDKMNKVLEGSNRRFQYTIHEGTNEIMIKVIDESTREVIKEIPPKKILDMIASLMEIAGLLVDERR